MILKNAFRTTSAKTSQNEPRRLNDFSKEVVGYNDRYSSESEFLNLTSNRNERNKVSSRLVDQISESGLHFVMQGLEVGLDLGLAVLRRVLELHRRQLVQDVAHGFANNRPKEKKC